MPHVSALWLRYGAAILLTAGLMVWQSGDTVRAGTAEFGDTVSFWLISVTAGWLQMILIARGVRATFDPAIWPGWALLVLGALIGTIPLSFEVRWLVATLMPAGAGMPPPWVTYLNVAVINVVFSLIQYVLIERWPLGQPVGTRAGPEHGPNPETNLPDPPTVSHLRRRPDGVNGIIRYLRMEDHYLNVYTDHGAGMVLYRMGDAVDDLRGTDGMQVHKSWWVARHAVTGTKNHNRRRILVLNDGTEVPVGRSYESELRAAGWI